LEVIKKYDGKVGNLLHLRGGMILSKKKLRRRRRSREVEKKKKFIVFYGVP
jgi:hypothetical protein